MRLKDTNKTNFILTCKMRRMNYIIKYHTTLMFFSWSLYDFIYIIFTLKYKKLTTNVLHQTITSRILLSIISLL
jgi:hypothetical protein